MTTIPNYTSDTARSAILALPESPLTDALHEHLIQQDWTVHRTPSCAKARRLACRYLPDVLILPADSPDESGWLTCAKLMRAQPRLRIVLVGERTAFSVRFARFVGAAALVPAGTGAEEIVARCEPASCDHATCGLAGTR